MKKIVFTLASAMLFIACSKDQSLKNETDCIGLGLANKSVEHGGQPFNTTLSGAQEVPNAGDPDGSGTFKMTVNPGQATISYELTVSNIAPASAAHIHKAPFGVPGPVVIHLAAPATGSTGGTVATSRALIDDIRKNPSHYYVNVHNPAYPTGAVRGQLSK